MTLCLTPIAATILNKIQLWVNFKAPPKKFFPARGRLGFWVQLVGELPWGWVPVWLRGSSWGPVGRVVSDRGGSGGSLGARGGRGGKSLGPTC